MFRKTLPPFGLCLIVLCTAFAWTSSTAAQYQYTPPNQSNTLTAHLVKTGLYVFSGASNSLLRMSANGLIVVDGQPAASYDELVAQINRLSDQPIRLLITTDHHQQRTGNNAKFLADGAQVLAHENVTKNLAKAGSTGARIPPPTKTYDRELPVSLGGVDVKVMHFGNAHTNADTVVYFPNLKVVAVGDLFASTPDPDFAAGGSMIGWGPVLAETLKLDFDVVVPGSGPTVTRTDLEAFRKKIDTVVTRASELVKKGVPKTQLMAQLKTDDVGWRFNFTGTRLDAFYSELSHKP